MDALVNPDNATNLDKAPAHTKAFLALVDAIYEEAKRIDPYRRAQCERALNEELRHAPRSY